MKPEIQKVLATAKEYGFTLSVSGSIARVSRSFTPGDKKAFCECDMMASSVLDLIPNRGGSVWGTDGGSIGGAIAIQTGKFTMNQSGCSKRFVAELQKYL